MKSMTGFGKALAMTEAYQIEVEVKSVNHRFLDMQLRIPRQFNAIEHEIRQLIKQTVSRGRIEVYITLTSKKEEPQEVIFKWQLLEQFIHEANAEVQKRFNLDNLPMEALLTKLMTDDTFFEVRKLEEVIATDEVLRTVEEAIAQLDEKRQQEGVGLQKVLNENHQLLLKEIQYVETFVQEYEKDYQKKFEQKLMDYLGTEVEQSRLLTEMAILIERGDIHEEIDRMNLHLHAMSKIFISKEPVGRQLDFLIQEMNREINTIGSKSSPINIKNSVVTMKTIIEKIREQVQNIE